MDAEKLFRWAREAYNKSGQVQAKVAEILTLRSPDEVAAALSGIDTPTMQTGIAAATMTQSTKVPGEDLYNQISRHELAWDILSTQFDKCAKYGAGAYKLSERQLAVVALAIYRRAYIG